MNEKGERKVKVLNYISNLAMPLIILIIVFYSLIERKKAFDI